MSLELDQANRISDNLKKSITNYGLISAKRYTVAELENLQKSETAAIFSESGLNQYLEKANIANPEEAKEVQSKLIKSMAVNAEGKESQIYILPLLETFEEIKKSEDGEESKLLKAVYSDNPVNKKLGRVGKEYGSANDNDEAKKKVKTEDPMISEAHKIKGEYESLKKKLKKDPSEANKAKFAAKEEQLIRVANAIRAKRADSSTKS